MGEDHTTWNQVQDSVSLRTTTISYDRAGLGLSKYNGEKKDLVTMSNELHQLMSNSQIKDPVILVGHSLGCQIIKKFALMYPMKVRSIVFIDPGYNPANLRLVLSDSLWNAREEKLKQYMPKLNPAQQAEFDQLEKNTEQADDIIAFPDVPVVLFTATLITDFPASKQEVAVKKQTHEKWLSHNPNAKHFTVEDSRHYIHNDHPELIINTILELL